jgi:hypothetical protein
MTCTYFEEIYMKYQDAFTRNIEIEVKIDVYVAVTEEVKKTNALMN